MPQPMRIRATVKDGVVDVRVQIRHPMESGSRKDEAGELIPAWYITRFSLTAGDRLLFAAQLGPGVARDPLLHIRVDGLAAGDEVLAAWEDSRGETQSDRARVEAL
jgi:sulfur-oxidizing protein SoxZ